MVKIFSLSYIEEQKKVRVNDLVRIASEVIGDKFEASRSTMNNVLVKSRDREGHLFITVSSEPHIRVVSNNAPGYDNYAIKLAQAYEDRGMGEFTLHRNYPSQLS